MKQIEDILDIAKTVYLEEQLREESLSWYKDFQKFVTPLVREKFNIPRFEMQYYEMGMVSKDAQVFIEKEEEKFKNKLL